MSEDLAFRHVGAAGRWYAAPLMGEVPSWDASPLRPVVYIAPLDRPADVRVVRASLARAGLEPPAWVPCRQRRAVDEQALQAAFLAAEPVLVPISAAAGEPDPLGRLLAWAQKADVDVDLVPLEVLWGPRENRTQLRKLLLGNPFRPPGWLRWLHVRRQDHCRVVTGAAGSRAQLEREALRAPETIPLPAFVRARALGALSRAQREAFGERLRVPRLLADQILADPHFQERVLSAGGAHGLSREDALERAREGLEELAAGHRRLAMEIFQRLCGRLIRVGYDARLDVDARTLARLRELSRSSALVFIPSHQSNYDHLVMYHVLFGAGFLPPFTAAGINLAFWPFSRLLPATGAYFIRRGGGDDPVYRECLRGFIAYLVHRRFHQEFFIEGGRTRSGKLLPPRYGVLRYVVEAALEDETDEVQFVPVSISYDQVLEVGEYVQEQLGARKPRETIPFVLRQIRKARQRKLGVVRLRFAEPLSLREHLRESAGDPLALEKLAFRISTRINQARPLLPTAAVCSTLLAHGARGLTRTELLADTEQVIRYAQERGIELGAELSDGAAAALDAGVDALEPTGTVAIYRDGTEPVFYVPAEHRHAASFYRNSVIHFFLPRAIAELAERCAGGTGEDDTLAWALRLRELLKFEFFFSRRDDFERELGAERARLAAERARGDRSLAASRPRILLDFLESYWVVTESLRSLRELSQPLERERLLERCHALGRQLLLQERVTCPELLSSVTFGNALDLLENLGTGQRTPEGFEVLEPGLLESLARDLERLSSRASAG